MTKELQKRFVVTAMTAITVLILLLLGVINAANIVSVDKKIDENLHMIAENEGDVGNLMAGPDSVPREPAMDKPKNDYDTFLSSNFFVVRFDENGQAVFVDVSRTSAVSEGEAMEMAEEIYGDGKVSGRRGRFHYLMEDSGRREGKTVVFLDTSEERFSYIRVLLLSCAVGIACWGLMLVFVILLSRRAIRPIAENIEKQRQFVTNAGHEIKTPLAIIQSNTEAMELYTGENKWSRNIKEQTMRLDGLMKNLLTLARMEEGTAGVQKTEFCLSALMEEKIQDFLPLMEEKAICLQTDIQPETTLYADPGQIGQLLSILLDNAVKYADEGGQIWIRLKKQDRQTEIKFQNTCQQLPDVPAEQLFDRFYRADAARTQKNGGYGIGLSVARSIMEASDGTIEAEYIQPDNICFTVIICPNIVNKK